MADFSPKKESSKAKGSLAKDNTEHQSPPTIYLEHHHLEKLGMTKMPPVGSKIKISGLAHVGATSEHDDSRSAPKGSAEGSGKRRSMTLHMHKMDVGTDRHDHEESQKAGMKAAVDKALTKGEGSESEGDGEQ